jgi:hypothetical protein
LELIAHFSPLLTHFFVSSIIDVLEEIQKICKKQLLNFTPIFHAYLLTHPSDARRNGAERDRRATGAARVADASDADEAG